MVQLLWLLPLGFIVGTFGTMIGVGGGFILVPVLLMIYPEKNPEIITGMSLAVVFFNSLSGSIAYARMKRIDVKSGIVFATATIPGSVLGTLTTSLISRTVFNCIFGLLLITLAIFLTINPGNRCDSKKSCTRRNVLRTVVDSEGKTYTFSYNPLLGIFISMIVGYLSSLLGIGGGIIHVPALIHLLNYPVHIATATSLFMLTVMSLSSTAIHISQGILQNSVIQVAGLSIGVVFGAQIGARISARFDGTLIIRSLAIALGIVGLRILMMAI